MRKLGTTEHLWKRMGEIDSNNFVMVAKVSGDFDLSKLTAAVCSIVENQITLRYKLKEEGGHFYFEDQGFFRPKVIEKTLDESALNSFFESELNETIPVDCFPLWRFHVVRCSGFTYFVLTFNHMISDGRSGSLFFKYLLKTLASVDYVIPRAEVFPPFEEELMTKSGFVRFMFSYLRALKNYVVGMKRKWYRIDSKETGLHGSGVLTRELSKEKVSKLLKLCREKGVTISGALATVLAESLSLSKGQNVGVSLAADMRPLLERSRSSEIGYFVSTLDLVNHANSKQDFWFLVKSMNSQINSCMTKGQARFDGLIKRLALTFIKKKESFKKVIKKSVNNTVLLTNLCRLELEESYGELTLHRCYHIPSVHLIDIPFIAVATVTFGDAMILNFSYPKALIPLEAVEAYADNCLSMLNELA